MYPHQHNDSEAMRATPLQCASPKLVMSGCSALAPSAMNSGAQFQRQNGHDMTKGSRNLRVAAISSWMLFRLLLALRISAQEPCPARKAFFRSSVSAASSERLRIFSAHSATVFWRRRFVRTCNVVVGGRTAHGER